jgi:hypothetical protein
MNFPMQFIADRARLLWRDFKAVKLDGYAVFLFSVRRNIFNHLKWMINIFFRQAD